MSAIAHRPHVAMLLSNPYEPDVRAQKQAHERIIGERQVGNEEKILSLYEGHAAVYVRGQTEARIAIFKNAFLGAPLLAKGYENQGWLVAWNVFTHNLWLLAGLPKRESCALSKAS